jgi:hypothetical protein
MAFQERKTSKILEIRSKLLSFYMKGKLFGVGFEALIWG